MILLRFIEKGKGSPQPGIKIVERGVRQRTGVPKQTNNSL
jgi:hypothetical protein